MYEEFDEAEGGFNDLPIGGFEVFEEREEDFGMHVNGDIIWQIIIRAESPRKQV